MPSPSSASAFMARRRGLTCSYPESGGSIGMRIPLSEPPFTLHVNIMHLGGISVSLPSQGQQNWAHVAVDAGHFSRCDVFDSSVELGISEECFGMV